MFRKNTIRLVSRPLYGTTIATLYLDLHESGDASPPFCILLAKNLLSSSNVLFSLIILIRFPLHDIKINQILFCFIGKN